jgi:hypoxanthine phosphoribosyltransferase
LRVFRFPPANFWYDRRQHNRSYQRANSWNPFDTSGCWKRLNSQGDFEYNPSGAICQAGGPEQVTDQTDDIAEILISAEAIAAKVKELGGLVADVYQGNDLLLVSVLKGSVVFLTDLMRAIPMPLAIDFLAISGYGGKGAAGVVRILKDLEQDITGRHVLVVEDIVDTGLTLGYLLRTLRAREPASVRVCTLLDRSVRRIVELPMAFRGFDVPDRFVVGYGLDYQQRYRNLPFIGVLKPDVR